MFKLRIYPVISGNKMKIYKSRPTPRKARQVWDYVTRQRGKQPISLHKNPNCWMKPQVTGNAWGWWVAEFDSTHYPYELMLPSDIK